MMNERASGCIVERPERSFQQKELRANKKNLGSLRMETSGPRSKSVESVAVSVQLSVGPRCSGLQTFRRRILVRISARSADHRRDERSHIGPARLRTSQRKMRPWRGDAVQPHAVQLVSARVRLCPRPKQLLSPCRNLSQNFCLTGAMVSRRFVFRLRRIARASVRRSSRSHWRGDAGRSAWRRPVVRGRVP